MVFTGDKQPLTPAESGGQQAEGIVGRTRRSLSAVLGDKMHKPSSRNSHRNGDRSDLRGWQNPSYEMTEMEAQKEAEISETKVDQGNVEAGKKAKTGKHVSKSRRKDREGRRRPDALIEEHELEDRPGGHPASAPSASVSVVDETAVGQGDGPAGSGGPPSRPPRRPRRSRKKAHLPSDQQAAELVETHGRPRPAEDGSGEPTAPAAPSDQVLGVMVHQADRLDGASWHLSRPMVRVQLVDASTGQPVRKCDPQRRVTYFYEPDGVETILPALTRPGAAAGGGLLAWDELLLFNEPVSRLTADEPRVCLLFELTTARPELSTAAWAFLRLRSAAGGRLNTERRLRLQLYRPPADRAARAAPALSWWRATGRRHRLPATLHVTVSALRPPALEPGRRSLFPTQPEEAVGAAASPEPDTHRPSSPQLPVWSRLSGQQCRLPNARRATLADDCESCLTLRFDGGGQRLACAVQRAAQFPVLVYQVASGQRSHALLGHAGLVYDLRWADDRLLTASADWTARLWHLHEAGRYSTLVLPHPGYVYSALFHPTSPRYLATGCFDGTVRLWESDARETPGAEPRLSDELAAGEAPVNSLCCAGDGRRLYAGDARGQLSVWSWHETGGRPQVTLERRLAPEGVRGAAIDHLELHPAGRRLLVQVRRGVIVALDSEQLVPLQTLGGHLHSRSLVRGAVTPCGTYYLSGAEDGCLHVWTLDSGERCATYTALGGTRPLVGVHFHPWEHMAAVASHRDPRVTVQLVQHERTASGAQLGLSLLPRAIQPAPADETSLPPVPPARAEPADDERDKSRFQAILDRLDSVIEVARTGPTDERLSETVQSAPCGPAPSEGDAEPPAVHRSRHRRRRRERKEQEALSRTDPGV